ncbi:hypothetical protein Tco_0295102 [Tanacetum coccineum]
MSTSNNSNQQTLADSGANERPPMLEKGNYIPWEIRFRRFLDNKLEDGERMWNSIQNGPYQRPMILNPYNTQQQILKPLSKMTEGNKKQYIADVRVMNYLVQEIQNDIYNSLDACKNGKEMWERIKRLMFGSEVTSHVRHSHLMDKFDKFAAKEGESLESVYERLTTLVNIMDRNNVRPISVSINTKFLNCLQPEWSKYVTMNHDPLALLAHSNASSSQSHTNSSYSSQPYYVTHPSSVVDYDDEYQGELQGDSQEDKLTTAMMLLARAISQKFSTPTNNLLRISSNTRNQAVVQDDRVDIQTKNAGYGGNANKNAGKQNRNQMMTAIRLFSGEETMEELTAAVILMARIQPADGNTENVPSYDAKAVSEVYASSKVHDQMTGLGYKNPECLKKVIAAQPKMYNGDMLHSVNLKIDSPDSEETLEDAEESRLKMRNKMVQINNGKLNALYETIVPQLELSVEQTYFSIPSTSNNGSESKDVTSDLPIPKMPKESKMLKMFDTMGVEINGLQTRIDKTLLEDRERRCMSDNQNSLR